MTTIDADDLATASSREASNTLLSALRDGGWRPSAWSKFTLLACSRSASAAAARPRALIETSAIHAGALLATTRRNDRIWVAMSWVMAATHLGMLNGRSSLGVPNVLTMIRGILPALQPRLGRSLPIISLATDFADGKIARATGTVTPFGRQADFLADTAFWMWFAARHEPSRVVKIAAVAAWVAPVIAVTVASVGKGGMVDIPRAWWFRPAAIVEVLLGGRAIVRLVSRAA